MNATVQPLGWQSALPRPAYKEYRSIKIPQDNWYEIYQPLPGVFALYEPGHFQEVISFLIIGKKQAILWDTGMGIAPIRPVVEVLTSLPIIVINSHCHFDHVGGNWEFPLVYAYSTPFSIKRSKIGYEEDFLNPMLTGDSLANTTPKAFDCKHFKIRPWTFEPIYSGQIIDIGARSLEVIHTPGHTDDSIMLLDKDNKILFTGDTIYPAALYAHFGNSHYGYSNLDKYAKTMSSLAKLAPNLSYLCCSHNIARVDPKILTRVDLAFSSIIGKKALGQTDSEGLTRYDFDDFSIIINRSDLNNTCN